MTHPADRHDLIRVQGARENNLKDVSLELPKRRLTAFTGVSGSGKSSLVFATIAAESQRMINETYSAFVQGFMPSLARPDVDLLDGLTTAIIVDQERMGANPRSTVGTATDANAMLRILFSRIGTPHIGPPTAFAFNVPTRVASGVMKTDQGDRQETSIVRDAVYQGGMCARCEGMGSVNDFDLTAIYDESKSLSEGALLVPGYSMDGWYGRIFSGAGLPMDKPVGTFTDKQLQKLLYGQPEKIKVEGVNLTYEGVLTKVQKSMLSKDLDAMQPHVRRFVERAVTFTTCPDCNGTRLSQEALSLEDQGQEHRRPVLRCRSATSPSGCATSTSRRSRRCSRGLQHLLDSFAEIGLGYLSLDRPAGTLSGGEAQRTKMIRHLGSSLTDVTYVFDEPTIGLHPHDIDADEPAAAPAARQGQHRPRRRAQAGDDRDRRPRRRPRPGCGHRRRRGGLRGHRRGAAQERHHHRPPPRRPGQPQGRRCARPAGALEVRGASTHNLRDVDVDIPLGVLCVVTGVAGSGKSSLIHGSVAERDGVVVVDQGAIRGSRRSNPATYTGLLEPIRKAFAKVNGVKPALFSSNSEGACPACNGAGVIYTELGVMATVESTCEECEGRRFQAAVLEYRLGGRNIAEVLAMPVAEALGLLRRGRGADAGRAQDPRAARRRRPRLPHLGQPLTTLSGGERQRLKLAAQMAEKGDVYVLDEPTTGLHLADVEQLLGLLDRLVESGKSVRRHRAPPGRHGARRLDHRPRPGAGHDGGRGRLRGPTGRARRAPRRRSPVQHLARIRRQLTLTESVMCAYRATSSIFDEANRDGHPSAPAAPVGADKRR